MNALKDRQPTGRDPSAPGQPPRSAVVTIVLFVLIAAAFAITVYFYASLMEKPAVNVSEQTPVRVAGEPTAPPPESGRPLADDGAETAPQDHMPAQGVLDREARRQRIKRLAEEIFDDLKEREVLTTDTLYLTTGQVVHCTILEQSDSSVKIRSQGVTTLVERDRIEKIESRSAKDVEHELRGVALRQAVTIVDEGLVRYGDEWISPQEREQRVHVARTRADIEELEARRRTDLSTPRPPAPTPAAPAPTGGTDYSTATVIEGFGFTDMVLGHPGCTRAYVKNRLGPPDSERPQVLDYDSTYGMEFIFASDGDMLIEIHLNRGFKGKLAAGITLSSTMDQVFHAYGSPVGEEEVGDFKKGYSYYRNRTLYRKDRYARLSYGDIGLLFWFDGDSISQIVVHRTH